MLARSTPADDFAPPAGTDNIVANVNKYSETCPQSKIVVRVTCRTENLCPLVDVDGSSAQLAGMSQGASATTTAIQRIDLNSAQGKSIAAVLLLGKRRG